MLHTIYAIYSPQYVVYKCLSKFEKGHGYNFERSPVFSVLLFTNPGVGGKLNKSKIQEENLPHLVIPAYN